MKYPLTLMSQSATFEASRDSAAMMLQTAKNNPSKTHQKAGGQTLYEEFQDLMGSYFSVPI